MREHQLFANLVKCDFMVNWVELLRVILTPIRVEMDPVKVTGISEWPQLQNLRDLGSFIGFCNFYRRFIEGFSTLACPINDLTKKGVVFEWGPAQEEAFQTLKRRITSSLVLTQLDPAKPYHLECDASGFATGAILSQQQEDGLWHPVSFISALMTEQQQNYNIFDKEMLAIINALEVWQHLLEGKDNNQGVVLLNPAALIS